MEHNSRMKEITGNLKQDVKDLLGDLMDQRFDGLGLAHAGAEGNLLFRVVVRPMDARRQGALADRDGGDGF